MKTNRLRKLIFVLPFLLLLQSCSNVPKVIQPKELSEVRVWSKSIQEYLSDNGSLYKLDRKVNDGIDYVNGEWSQSGTYVKALDSKSKQELWKFPVQADTLTNPVFDETRIFFGTSLGMYYALDKKTGNELWCYKAPKEIYDFNNIHEKSVLFRDYDSKVYSLDTETGSLNWTFELSSLFGSDYSIFSGPTYSAGILFFAIDRNKLIGIDAGTGTEKWSIGFDFKDGDEFYLQNGLILTMENIKFKKNTSMTPKSEIYDFKDIVSENNSYVLLQAFDVLTGQKLWSNKVKEIDEQNHLEQIITKEQPLWSFAYNIRYELPPIFTKQRVYFNDRYLALHGFDLRTGKKEIEINLMPFHVIRKFYSPSLTVINDQVYFLGADSTLKNAAIYAIDISKVKLLWQKQLVDNLDSEFKSIGPYLFVTLSNRLLVLNNKNGDEIQNITIPFDYEIAEILQNTLVILRSNPSNKNEDYAFSILWKK